MEVCVCGWVAGGGTAGQTSAQSLLAVLSHSPGQTLSAFYTN